MNDPDAAEAIVLMQAKLSDRSLVQLLQSKKTPVIILKNSLNEYSFHCLFYYPDIALYYANTGILLRNLI